MSREDFIEALKRGSNFQRYEERLPAILDGTPDDMRREWGIGGYGLLDKPGVYFDSKGIHIGGESMGWPEAHRLLQEIHGRGQGALF